jgi:hypothetical protein
MLANHGHTVVRVSPYKCYLKSGELGWAKSKRPVRESKVTADMNVQKLLQITKDSVSLATKNDWKRYCKHVENIEKEY